MNSASSNWLDQIRALLRPKAPAPAPTPEPPRRIGLALAGGGGKGPAHLGVIQVIEDLGLPVDLMVGTSAGGAVAVLYAAGYTPAEIRDLFRNSELRRVAVPDHDRLGLFGQRRREEMLIRLLGERTFADLRFPCAVVATDLVSGKSVVINEGPLVPALLATTALPSLFPPVLMGDAVLVDGGILNNLPVDVATDLGATRVIAVELNDAGAEFSLAPVVAANPLARLTLAPQQLAIASRAISLLINNATNLHLRQYPPALLLSPEVADIPTLDMSNPEKAHQAGVVAAREASEELLALRAWRLGEAEQPPVPAQQPAAPAPPVLIDTDDPLNLDPPAPQPPQRLRLPIELPRWGERR